MNAPATLSDAIAALIAGDGMGADPGAYAGISIGRALDVLAGRALLDGRDAEAAFLRVAAVRAMTPDDWRGPF